MNDFTRQAAILVASVWRHRWTAVAVAWLVAILGALVVMVVPERREARASIYVDTQTVLRPMMVGLAFQPDIDQQVRMLGRTLISRPNVERLVNNPTIGLEKVDPSQVDSQIENLMKTIKVVQTGGNNLYAISYRDVDGERARRLVEGLVALFMESGVDSKRKDSAEASRFIDEQITAYESKLTEAENRLKEFKLKNMNVASTQTQDFFGRIQSMTDEVNRLRVQLNAAERSREAIRRDLESEEPQLPMGAASAVSLTPDLDERIRTLKRQLDDMERRFTDNHPDVRTTRRMIAELEQGRRDELARLQAENPKRRAAATNPVYQRLRNNLSDAEASVASLRGQLEAQVARLDEIRSQANQVPQAEAELAQLNRDYEIMRRNYDQLVQRREAASLGVKIDQTSSMADFRLIEPPRLLPSPVFPGKLQMAAGVMLLALLAGGAVAYAMTLLNPTFASERELREFTKRPVLGSLTKIEDPRDRDLQRQDRMKLAGVMGLFLLANVGWMAWISTRTAS
jgi:polysaccharide chain length determinant protein (PEP-CTERM system associated)